MSALGTDGRTASRPADRADFPDCSRVGAHLVGIGSARVEWKGRISALVIACTMESVIYISEREISENELLAVAARLGFICERNDPPGWVSIKCTKKRWSVWMKESTDPANLQYIGWHTEDGLVAAINSRTVQHVWDVDIPWDGKDNLIPLFKDLLGNYGGVVWYSVKHVYDFSNIDKLSGLFEA